MVNLLRGARIDFFHFFTLLTINKIDNNGFRTASELAISVCFCKGRQGCIGNEFQLRRQRRDRQIPGLREARGIALSVQFERAHRGGGNRGATVRLIELYLGFHFG